MQHKKQGILCRIRMNVSQILEDFYFSKILLRFHFMGRNVLFKISMKVIGGSKGGTPLVKEFCQIIGWRPHLWSWRPLPQSLRSPESAAENNSWNTPWKWNWFRTKLKMGQFPLKVFETIALQRKWNENEVVCSHSKCNETKSRRPLTN